MPHVAGQRRHPSDRNPCCRNDGAPRPGKFRSRSADRRALRAARDL